MASNTSQTIRIFRLLRTTASASIAEATQSRDRLH